MLVVWFPAKSASRRGPALVDGPRADGPHPQVSTVTIQSIKSARVFRSEESQELVEGSLKATRFNQGLRTWLGQS